MKILVISTVAMRLNGISAVIMNYYSEIKDKDIRIDVAAPFAEECRFTDELKSNHSKLYILPRGKKFISSQMKLFKILKKENYDIVHVHGNSSLMITYTLLAKMAGVRNILVHSHNTTCNSITLHKLVRPLFRLTYTKGLACGIDAGKWLYGKSDFIELKNGINLEDYRYNAEIRKAYREKINAGDRIVLGNVANFIEQKNHSFLIDSFAELLKKDSNYLLLLISEGYLMDSMKKKVRELGISDNVIFLGKTNEVNNYLQAMDMFLLPSLYEGLPVVIIEAQAAGLKCILSDKITREVDLTDSIRFCPIGDPKDWARAVLETEPDDSGRAERCEKWQNSVSDAGYDIAKNAKKLKKMYINLGQRHKKQ